jgi:hypothetical protein
VIAVRVIPVPSRAPTIVPVPARPNSHADTEHSHPNSDPDSGRDINRARSGIICRRGGRIIPRRGGWVIRRRRR